MDIEEYRAYCLNKAMTSEHFPFDDKVLVFKVAGKMFALCDVDEFRSINLKCDPEKAILLREEFDEIEPGYHMNKKHWNTISMHGTLTNKLIKELIDESYNLVVKGLPKKTRDLLSTQD
jgi:predicted DNA-binding protein (MmcQ/YjbR family)